MSLATRCTACATVFRVVQDQLKVSEGWVRCGRCNQVFNALDGLFDLGRGSLPEEAAVLGLRTEAAQPATDAPQAPDAPGEVAPTDDDQPLQDKIDAQLMSSRESLHDSTPATRISERDRLEFPDAQFDPDMLAEDSIGPRRNAPGPVAGGDAHFGAGRDFNSDLDSSAPEFVRRAEWQTRRPDRGLRVARSAALALLLLAAGLQVVHQFRDSVAARWPGTNDLLVTWCKIASCAIEATRRIEDVAVESTSLARAAAPDAFRLSVLLRNRGAMPVAVPSVDLSLTDATGQLLTRRVLGPRDFRVASTSIRPGAESALQLVLAVGGSPVAGYTVEVFYP
jgi:predicted Zn finger-like uncharacterized protein